MRTMKCVLIDFILFSYIGFACNEFGCNESLLTTIKPNLPRQETLVIDSNAFKFGYNEYH